MKKTIIAMILAAVFVGGSAVAYGNSVVTCGPVFTTDLKETTTHFAGKDGCTEQDATAVANGWIVSGSDVPPSVPPPTVCGSIVIPLQLIDHYVGQFWQKGNGCQNFHLSIAYDETTILTAY